MNEASVPSYPLSAISVLVRRHVHEVRNALNGMELELTLLDSGLNSSASREAVARLREAMTEIGKCVQGLSAKFGTETPSSILALQIAERWKADARQVTAEPADWQIQFSDETVCVESALMRTVLLELLEVAIRMGGARLQFHCRRQQNQALFEVTRAGGGRGSEMLDDQRSYWAAVRRLAERNQGVVEPELLAGDTLWLRLSLPVQAT